MSEIAKCPCCGDGPDILVDLFDKHGKYPKGYSCCGAELAELDQWNQYAAAMELAKAEVAAFNAAFNVPLERLEAAIEASEDMLFQARMRVLEVFK